MGKTSLTAHLEHPATGTWNGALQSLLLAATALFLLNFNIIETAGVSKRLSQDLIYAKFGNEQWLYPRTVGPAARGAHPSVVVVMIDEPALALRNAQWPVPLQFHAEFLAELAVLKPRAIMLDFLLLDRARPTDTCALLGVAAELRNNGTPLYLAVTRLEDIEVLKSAVCLDPGGKTLNAQQLLTPVSVARQADRTDFVNRLYPFELRNGLAPPGSGLPSAAVRVYCDSTPEPNACLRRLTDHYPPEAGFDLAWSPTGDPFNRRWSHAACDEIPSPGRAILRPGALPRDNPCPPLPTLFASALLNPADDPTLGEQNEQLFGLIGGSFIFVGGNFRGTGDLMTTPMHALLPGVYYHAVALENLLAFEGNPKVRKEFRHPKLGYYLYDLAVLWALAGIFLWRQHRVARRQPHIDEPLELSPTALAWIETMTARVPTPVWVFSFVILLVLLATFKILQLTALAAAFVVLVAIELGLSSSADIKERLRCLALYVAALVLSLGVIAIAIWVGYRWLTLPPGDWIGYISFAAVGFFVTHSGILEFERRVAERRLARVNEAET